MTASVKSMHAVKLEEPAAEGGAGSAAVVPVTDRYTEYVRLFSAPFSTQQFEQLHGHYYTARAVAEGRGENSTRSGRERLRLICPIS